jgi:hypothetical protein
MRRRFVRYTAPTTRFTRSVARARRSFAIPLGQRSRSAQVRKVGPRSEVFATGDAGTVRGDGTTWSVETSLHGRSLSGAGNDVWLAGYFTNVQRFDGTAWSQVTTRAVTPMLVSVGDADITFPGAARGRLRRVRDRRARLARGLYDDPSCSLASPSSLPLPQL